MLGFSALWLISSLVCGSIVATMSELATEYYAERAARLGIETIPDILDGQPHLI
jgi:hypothetical protein